MDANNELGRVVLTTVSITFANEVAVAVIASEVPVYVISPRLVVPRLLIELGE